MRHSVVVEDSTGNARKATISTTSVDVEEIKRLLAIKGYRFIRFDEIFIESKIADQNCYMRSYVESQIKALEEYASQDVYMAIDASATDASRYRVVSVKTRNDYAKRSAVCDLYLMAHDPDRLASIRDYKSQEPYKITKVTRADIYDLIRKKIESFNRLGSFNHTLLYGDPESSVLVDLQKVRPANVQHATIGLYHINISELPLVRHWTNVWVSECAEIMDTSVLEDMKLRECIGYSDTYRHHTVSYLTQNKEAFRDPTETLEDVLEKTLPCTAKCTGCHENSWDLHSVSPSWSSAIYVCDYCKKQTTIKRSDQIESVAPIRNGQAMSHESSKLREYALGHLNKLRRAREMIDVLNEALAGMSDHVCLFESIAHNTRMLQMTCLSLMLNDGEPAQSILSKYRNTYDSILANERDETLFSGPLITLRHSCASYEEIRRNAYRDAVSHGIEPLYEKELSIAHGRTIKFPTWENVLRLRGFVVDGTNSETYLMSHESLASIDNSILTLENIQQSLGDDGTKDDGEYSEEVEEVIAFGKEDILAYVRLAKEALFIWKGVTSRHVYARPDVFGRLVAVAGQERVISFRDLIDDDDVDVEVPVDEHFTQIQI